MDVGTDQKNLCSFWVASTRTISSLGRSREQPLEAKASKSFVFEEKKIQLTRMWMWAAEIALQKSIKTKLSSSICLYCELKIREGCNPPWKGYSRRYRSIMLSRRRSGFFFNVIMKANRQFDSILKGKGCIFEPEPYTCLPKSIRCISCFWGFLVHHIFATVLKLSRCACAHSHMIHHIKVALPKNYKGKERSKKGTKRGTWPFLPH